MEIEQKIQSGWPRNIIRRLNVSIGLYLKYYNNVKIGITYDPDRRMREHSRSCRYDWDRMILRYKTTSEKNDNEIEKWFIHNRPELVNQWDGDSHMPEGYWYFIYILLGDKK